MEEWYLFRYSVATFRISVNGVVRSKVQFTEFAADLFQLRALFYLPVYSKKCLEVYDKLGCNFTFYSCGCVGRVA